MSDEVIVNANEQFNCSNCNLSLIGQKYILNDEKPYCVACYESKFSHTCELCKEKITCDSKVSIIFFLLNCIVNSKCFALSNIQKKKALEMY